MAFLSKFLEQGEDPVQFLEEALSDMGFDSPLSDWSKFETKEEY